MISAEPISKILGAFACAQISPTSDASEILRLSLFDWATCGLAGKGEPVSKITTELVSHEAGTPEASVFGLATKFPARGAALANGTVSHALDFDDTHFAHIGHPSVAVIPAALAVAEATNSSMAEFQLAALLGVEAFIRFGVWLGRDHYQAGFHQTATAGSIGATIAAARLFNLSFEETTQALGLVGTCASGLKSQFGTMGKPFNAGLAASNGVEAAELARRGFQASITGLDGPQGFGPTHAGAADDSALQNLGEEWLFETVSHKFHACCHGLHAMLEAITALSLDDPKRISRIGVTTHPSWEKVCHITDPKTALECKFSYKMTAAMALSGMSTAKLENYSPETASDASLVALSDLVEVSFDEAVPETASRVDVAFENGTDAQQYFDLAEPLTLTDWTMKLKEKSAALLGSEQSQTLWNICQGSDLKAFATALR